ncbi:hypothetical protein MAR_016332 [Mya arenaria]|uniref:Uncharacterized protein n=1 Tax=Mya arenaria TaxID=6604 RepID=A0ABY7FNT9_MYAAR|nr:hypothetical protein MAR_016332 [Mya arenaria]
MRLRLNTIKSTKVYSLVVNNFANMKLAIVSLLCLVFLVEGGRVNVASTGEIKCPFGQTGECDSKTDWKCPRACSCFPETQTDGGRGIRDVDGKEISLIYHWFCI